MLDVHRPARVGGRPGGASDAMTEADPIENAELPCGILDIVADCGALDDRLVRRPGAEREAQGEDVGVRPDARISEQVPGAADAIARLEDQPALVLAAGLAGDRRCRCRKCRRRRSGHRNGRSAVRREPSPISCRPSAPSLAENGRKSACGTRKGNALDFDLTERQASFRNRVRDFMDAEVRPRVEDYHQRAENRRSLEDDRGHRGAETQGPRRRPVEPVHAARRRAPACRRKLPVRRRATHQPRICAVRGGDGADSLVRRGVQLLRARHRQHGGAPPLRHARAEGRVAQSADAGRNPLRLPDDRAGRCLVRRDQHPVRDPPRRQRIRRQRQEVVVVGRGRPALQSRDPDGQDRRFGEGP